MTSTKLVTELAALEKRREEIASEAGKAKDAYAASQQSLLSGAAQTSDLTTAHSASLALQAALSSLDGKIEQRKAEILAAEQSDIDAEREASVKALTAKALAAKQKHDAIAKEAWEALDVAANAMLDERARYNDLELQVRALDGKGLGFPEWQNVARGDQDFGPLVIQAALIAARTRGR
jgi:gamma-glutamyl phosphate reductase